MALRAVSGQKLCPFFLEIRKMGLISIIFRFLRHFYADFSVCGASTAPFSWKYLQKRPDPTKRFTVQRTSCQNYATLAMICGVALSPWLCRCAVRWNSTFCMAGKRVYNGLATAKCGQNYGKNPRYAAHMRCPAFFYDSATPKLRKPGPYGPKYAIYGLFFNILGLQAPKPDQFLSCFCQKMSCHSIC